ncbi:MAG TPA: NADH-quinone oxidoreductase subunit L, partial [Chloroflexota bacterium]|nr:NADH-quinone oxidoreductase subunit L [Chloroflexota bacterium]
MPSFLWLIPFLPVIGFLVIIFFTGRQERLSGYVAIGTTAASFVLAVAALILAIGRPTVGPPVPDVSQIPWYTVGGFTLSLGLLFDPLASVMLVVVTLVSLLVQIYSQGYMTGDPGYSRYFAFLGLFTTSMLGIVIAPNFLQLYVFWELVGLSSYLLIGFWWNRPAASAERPAPATAAVKAFVMTRVGDLGFLIGILIIFTQTKTFDFDKIGAVVKSGSLNGTLLAVAMILVFMGAVGKSAQFPLHAWLPDAMEGPTPVSALIHAATMVAAGVYLVARTFPLFSASPDAMLVVAWIGGFTALFAATQGLVMTDIKRVLAYSTISQLGYMMLGLGVGSLTAGTFHLMSHAFFKSLLFLTAGAVIHGTAGEQNMLFLGGLFKKMPITAITFLLGALALAAVPPFSGFWSKDEILSATFDSGNVVLFTVAMLTAGLTAFYIFRAWFLTFLGERRLNPDLTPSTAHDGHPGDVHESPPVMTIPLIILAVFAVLFGFVGSPIFHGAFQTFVGGPGPEYSKLNVAIAAASTGIGLVGIVIAWGYYGAHWFSAEATTRAFRPIHTLLVNKYYVDDFYSWLIRTVVIGLSDGL